MKITRLDPRTREPTADTWTLSRASRRLVIGRTAPADIRLDSPDVSPRHAELSWQAGSLTIRDLASINGITLRETRVLRAALQDQDVFVVGDIPFLVTADPADAAARRSRVLTLAGIALGSVLVAVFVLAFLRDARTPEAEAPPQDPTPLLPPIADAAFQQRSDDYAQAAGYLDESRRLIADGVNELRAAQLLQQALALNSNLPQASLLLQGLQDANGPAIRRTIDSLVAAGRFDDARRELDRQQALVGSSAAIVQVRQTIDQHLQFQSALDALDQDDLNTAQSLLDSLSDDIVPGRADALARLSRSRQALAWADEIQRQADRGQMDDIQRLADDEPRHAPYLSDETLSEVHGALARTRILGDIQHLVTVGNAYALMRYVDEVPQISTMLRPLRDTLAPQADALRQTADAESAKTHDVFVPLTLDDALASYTAAKALASLYIIHASPDRLHRFRRHSERWSAYLATIATRAQAYADRGARAEARAILQPLLPHLDNYDSATLPLRRLSTHLTPPSITSP